MTKKVDEKLNDLLDINTSLKKETKAVPMIRPDKQQNIETDYKYAREHLYDLIERGQDAIDGILDLSKETEHPRAYEVAGQLIKTVGETAEKLIDLQSKMKKLEQDDVKIRDQHNHLYVGSTSELQKFLKKNNGTSEE
ncbi:MAG: hypothetical protein CMD25_04820 [Flavobacteriales bacterium]|nr:hypothetical protein [Flavobacteriales bacterium]|tara:strand:- start:144 stop:557 length:414 start_codon:yes stop_codon:yes gene_type:complete